jgi:hypothetical protein
MIRGAASLNVRSGPGREYPSFATLKEGSKVEVEATEGSWVRIRTPAGEAGYVHKAFVVPLEAEETSQPPAAGRGVTPPGNVATGPGAKTSEEGSAVAGESEDQAQREDVLAGQRRIERLIEDVREDVKQLADLVQQKESHPGTARPTPTPTPLVVGATPAGAAENGSLLGLSIMGLVAGFVLGTIYGRRQERGRRTRVRF